MTAVRHGCLLGLWLLGLFASPLAAAWGAQGHRIVGDVAESLLEPVSRAEVRHLTGGQSLAEVATWMDEERPRLQHALPGSSAWHYEDRPVCPDPGADACPSGNCASRAIARYRAILADRKASTADRLLALRVIVHLMGDVHQPLHMADNHDRGGNEVAIATDRRERGFGRLPRHATAGRGGRSLHSVWDVDFVRRAVGRESETEFAADLLAEHARDLTRIESGTPEQWMAESHGLAEHVVYGRLPGFACGQTAAEPVVLTETYREAAIRTVREQLAAAGIRLAVVLRAALAGP